MGIPGARGMGGKKAINAGGEFNDKFDQVDKLLSDLEQQQRDDAVKEYAEAREKAKIKPKVAAHDFMDYGE